MHLVLLLTSRNFKRKLPINLYWFLCENRKRFQWQNQQFACRPDIRKLHVFHGLQHSLIMHLVLWLTSSNFHFMDSCVKTGKIFQWKTQWFVIRKLHAFYGLQHSLVMHLILLLTSKNFQRKLRINFDGNWNKFEGTLILAELKQHCKANNLHVV